MHNRVAISRALNGIGLALVTPSIQSLVADSTDDNNRGMAFGWLQLTGNVVVGIPGWRISFHLVGFISVVVGILVRLYATDPHFPDCETKDSSQNSSSSLWSHVKELALEAMSVIKIPSFQIVVAQGVTGSFPWSVFCLGGLFGGKMRDILSMRLPNAGRIILAQISSTSAIPLAAILLLALPVDPSTLVIHGFILFIMGFLISWNAPATNNPIFAEIVPERSRTNVYALDRSFKSILSSFVPPVVGILAQRVYGYKPVPQGSSASEEIATDRGNALSLAKALYTAIGIPMALCCVIYSFLYCTYPRDRERARMEVLIESEMQQIELEDSPTGGEYSRARFPESEELYVNDRTVIEVEYEGEDTLDADANDDEQTLLYH
ncbi:hypothetical protein D8674_012995 [Pyrus ussuriensis x Pyrus communis]|uniref:Major facilitator superfamily (MFS) profile domain-containing protein n=1 Tax=Pyrus ussuriensis x Pyrus communis TaxID=2448454 RepID=A0A5N5GNF2_9ROSA|nr:hypothetical protein D8674_012995 [Pyrus ussuriensis x Pyrus communis]